MLESLNTIIVYTHIKKAQLLNCVSNCNFFCCLFTILISPKSNSKLNAIEREIESSALIAMCSKVVGSNKENIIVFSL